MDSVLREQLRQQRHKHARERITRTHVEFCSSCGRAVDRKGRRNVSTCSGCSKDT